MLVMDALFPPEVKQASAGRSVAIPPSPWLQRVSLRQPRGLDGRIE